MLPRAASCTQNEVRTREGPIDTTIALWIVSGLAAALALLVAAILLRGARTQAAAADLSSVMTRLAAGQSELGGRLSMLSETVESRLAAVGRQLGDGISNQSERTNESLAELGERLVLIDAAQRNIVALSEEVAGLSDLLGNKQARGAFGEVQLEGLVRSALPPSTYQFQATLGNGRRADCLLRLPNPPGPIVVDAKFPLESYRALRNADGELEAREAARAFASAVKKHIADIAERYIVPGETAESALMFLPSEAVYAELHGNFVAVMEESYRRRVWIVSPTTLMATLNTVRAVLKDARVREQAGVIQIEVRHFLADVKRLDERIRKLATHVDQAGRDLAEVRISVDKLVGRAEKIESIELEGDAAANRPALATDA